jgi:metal transporter CNNM
VWYWLVWCGAAGALDLTNKIAYKGMTPLGAVFSLSTSDKLDTATLQAILASGHSRVPIHRGEDRTDLVGGV